MKKGFINVVEDEINDISNYLGKNADNISNASGKFKSGFSSMSKVGLFSNGINKIGNQLNAISGCIKDVQQSVIKQNDNLKNTEDLLANQAQDIEIPLDFVKNDTSTSVAIQTGSLSKDDGKSVTEGNNSENIDFKFEETITYNNKLQNIINEYEQKEQEYSDNYTKNLIDLENITSNVDQEEQKYDDSTIIQQKELSNINNGNEQNITDFGLEPSINAAILENILNKEKKVRQ